MLYSLIESVSIVEILLRVLDLYFFGWFISVSIDVNKFSGIFYYKL